MAGLSGDGYEEGVAAGQQAVIFVGEGGGAEVFAAFDAVLAALEGEGCGEWGGAEVLGFHAAGEGHDVCAVAGGVDGFAHGFVEDGGDDASVDETVGALEAFCEAQGGVDGAGVVNHEAQAHADAVVRAAAEAIVPVVEGQRSEMGGAHGPLQDSGICGGQAVGWATYVVWSWGESRSLGFTWDDTVFRWLYWGFTR